MTFQMAVGRYAGHLWDEYGCGIGGADYPDQEDSYIDPFGNYHLMGSHGIKLCVVYKSGKVTIG